MRWREYRPFSNFPGKRGLHDHGVLTSPTGCSSGPASDPSAKPGLHPKLSLHIFHCHGSTICRFHKFVFHFPCSEPPRRKRLALKKGNEIPFLKALFLPFEEIGNFPFFLQNFPTRKKKGNSPFSFPFSQLGRKKEFFPFSFPTRNF